MQINAFNLLAGVKGKKSSVVLVKSQEGRIYLGPLQ